MCPHAAVRRGRPRKRERERERERYTPSFRSHRGLANLEGQKLLVVLVLLFWNRDNCGARDTLAAQARASAACISESVFASQRLIGTSTCSNNLYAALKKTRFLSCFYSMTSDNLMLSFIASWFDTFDHRLLAKLTF